MNLLRRIRQALWGTTTNIFRAAAPADAKSAPTDAVQTLPHPHLYNETKWDRQRGNTEVTVLASAARTATGASAAQTNHNARGALLYIRVTAVSGTSPTLRIDPQSKDPISATHNSLTLSPNITATGSYQLACYPGAADTDGVIYNSTGLPLPRTWRVQYAIGGTSPSFTFSVSALYVV